MKKNRILYILLFTLFLGGCSEDFLVPELTSKLEADKVYSNASSIKATRIGIYNLLAGKNNSTGSLYQAGMPLCGSFVSNDVVYGNKWNQTFSDVAALKNSATTGWSATVWEQTYGITEVCNSIIKNEENIEKAVGKDLKDFYLADAKAVMAMVYSDVARFYANAYHVDNGKSLAIPFVDYVDYSVKPKRNTLDEIYKKSIALFNESLKSLQGCDNNQNYMNTNAVHALLSRIYLDMHNWDMAQKEAKMAMEGVTLMSSEEYATGISHISSETILAFSNTKVLRSIYRDFFSYHDTYDGMGEDLLINKSLVKKFGSNDLRTAFFIQQPNYNAYYPYKGKDGGYSAAAGYMKSHDAYSAGGKFPRRGAVLRKDIQGDLAVGDYNYIRGAEMVLVQAECFARMGKNTEAQNLLFDIQKRSIKGAVKSGSTGDTLLEEILLEKRKELFGEGHDMREVLRLGKGLVRDETNVIPETIPDGSQRFRWHVPEREQDINANLKDGQPTK
ncbi:RagB/SusD family nutrient uptake outer membrane protein [Halosquirtibacter laminarini]|uniref:RagB/SusD family nutrient uptake outer membrane protein n=1 Tax=Halosquirtibacter laminarini TaxID=3374600 RepID=A0AC61NCH9_9BACT|nr:RagB/SusD family nutrient uptake outer membrane protein [Prolixibacteraceae bacterium]